MKLGLVGSIQHLHLLPAFCERLEEAGFDVTVPLGGARLTFPGQVLGCNYSGDDDNIGHYLFLGSGDFHPIGLVLHTGKPLAMLDPYTGEATEMSLQRIERILRQRFDRSWPAKTPNATASSSARSPANASHPGLAHEAHA